MPVTNRKTRQGERKLEHHPYELRGGPRERRHGAEGEQADGRRRQFVVDVTRLPVHERGRHHHPAVEVVELLLDPGAVLLLKRDDQRDESGRRHRPRPETPSAAVGEYLHGAPEQIVADKQTRLLGPCGLGDTQRGVGRETGR